MPNIKKIAPKILTFHDIYPTLRMGLNTFSTIKLEKLISRLNEKYNLVTVSEILKEPDNKSLAAVTFDDGYESIYEFALPILKKYNAPASVMLISGFIGKENLWDPSPLSKRVKHLSLAQIKELQKNGWEMAPHGYYHFAYTYYNLSLIEKDLKKFINTFEQLEIELPEYISLPFGITDKKAIPLLKKHFPNLLGMLNSNPNIDILQRYPVYGFAKVDKILKDIENWPDISLINRFKLSAIHSGAAVSARWQKWFTYRKIAEKMAIK